MATKTLAQKIKDANTAGNTADAANEAAVADFLNKSTSLIDDLRLICGPEGLSDDLSWTARAKQVLQQIEVGLLKDPLTLKVVAKMREEQEAAAAASSSS